MPDIFHQLIIGAPAHKVYEALTTQKGVSSWWTPDATLIPEVGSIARFPFGASYFKEMRVTKLVPTTLVEWNCIQGDPEWIGTSIIFRLQQGTKEAMLNSHPEITGQMQQQNDSNDITLLSFNHNNWRDYTPMFGECSYTWAMFLSSLKLLCEKGQGRPWPNQHRVE